MIRKSTPDGHNPRPAVPTEEDAPAGNETLPADHPGTNQAVAIAGELQGFNPFTEMVGEVPLEAELRELAAQNSGVQITETYQIHTDTPAGVFISCPDGLSEIPGPTGMHRDVRVSHTYDRSDGRTHRGGVYY